MISWENNLRDNKFIYETMGKKLIYVYKLDYESEKGFLKVGDASIDKYNSDLRDNSEYLIKTAYNRIRQYEKSTKIDVLYATLAVDKDGIFFRDHAVHKVLERTGIKKTTKGTSTEWFETNLDIVIQAIDAVKGGNASINASLLNFSDSSSIVLRPEQEDAINKTIKVFKNNSEMLWNAKMRFGKTLSALELVKRSGFSNTLILTHRPIVDDGWYTDYKKIFINEFADKYIYASRNNGENLSDILNSVDKSLIYFASMQDLRGSDYVNDDSNLIKNEEVFKRKWDLIIMDEAHEGTTTSLAQNVLEHLKCKKTKILKLSGTPFNLIDDYVEEQIYTWDYVMEQDAKRRWDELHFGDSNPYSSLPEMNMFVYQLGDFFSDENFIDIESSAFNFHEFFRVENDTFVYEKYVWSFLNLISRSEDYAKNKTNMPFSTVDYREELRHTLWTMPTRTSTMAMEKLLKKHPLFQIYNIANLTDDGSDSNSLELIKQAIGNSPEENFSITLTVRKGTVGTTIEEWNGILVLNNTESASTYLQSIFRVQSPYIGANGQKEKAYVFDFAPDRTLKMVSEVVNLNTRGGAINSFEQKSKMNEFLNFLPIMGIDGNKMRPYNVDSMLVQLKRAQAERAVNHGFEDASIYSDELLKLTDADLNDFRNLSSIIGTTNQSKKVKKIAINEQGLTNEEYENAYKGSKKPPRRRTLEEQEAIDKKNTLIEQKKTMISILRGISIRIPLMIYGMDLEHSDVITLDNFAIKVDDVSWNEFMPNGVSKGEFKKFKKYYDADVFLEAARRIRNIALSADELPIFERIVKISELFATFKNPDKETVLTPWNVVNRHLSNVFGGYNFTTGQEYKFDNVTELVYDSNIKILEVNSKSGLYALYMAYNIYLNRWNKEQDSWDKSEWIKNDLKLWHNVLETNIFVLNKTPMSKTITYRTLVGYKSNEKIKSNLFYLENLTSKISTDVNFLKNTLKEGENMKFDVVVGNPPYQEVLNSDTSKAKQLFPYFIMNSVNMKPEFVSLITPARWYSGNAQDGSFVKLREFIRANNSIQKIHYYPDANDVFSDVEIKGGINYFLYNKNYSGKTEFVTHVNGQEQTEYRNLFFDGIDEILTDTVAITIINKVKSKNYNSLVEITTGRDAFGISGKKDNVNKLICNDPSKKKVALRCMNNEIIMIDECNVKKNINIMNSYKIFISKSAGDPKNDKKVIGVPFLARVGEVCTDTFIPVGMFNQEMEAVHLKKYMETKFLRYLVNTVKSSQNVYQIVYKFVPLLEFQNDSIIDWSKSIQDIDKQLYKHFELSNEEINSIEDLIDYR